MSASSIPDGPALRELEDAAVRMARGAGDVLQRYQPGATRTDYKGKDGKDPVTEADLRVEEYLREEISREFPDHGIVAEESADGIGPDNAEFLWAVDPLDGTKNFVAGLPFYAVSIGLMYRGIPVVGSLFLPPTYAGEGVYHARAGGGAFAEGTPLMVNAKDTPEPSGLASLPGGFGRAFSVRNEGGGGPGEPRTMGSIACEMVLVARGVFRVAVFTGSHIWDVAAGVVLIREAGGEVMEWRSGGWKPLQEFVVAQRKLGESNAQALRRWGTPLLTGSPGMVEQMAPAIKPRGMPLRHALRRVRSLWTGPKEGATPS